MSSDVSFDEPQAENSAELSAVASKMPRKPRVREVYNLQRISRKLSNSLAGLRAGWRSDGAVRTQLIFVAIALVALSIFRPPTVWVLSCLILLVVGLVAELLNGAIESLLDAVHPDTSPAIARAKDMASAAAFVANGSAAANLICALIFSS